MLICKQCIDIKAEAETYEILWRQHLLMDVLPGVWDRAIEDDNREALVYLRGLLPRELRELAKDRKICDLSLSEGLLLLADMIEDPAAHKGQKRALLKRKLDLRGLKERVRDRFPPEILDRLADLLENPRDNGRQWKNLLRVGSRLDTMKTRADKAMKALDRIDELLKEGKGLHKEEGGIFTQVAEELHASPSWVAEVWRKWLDEKIRAGLLLSGGSIEPALMFATEPPEDLEVPPPKELIERGDA